MVKKVISQLSRSTKPSAAPTFGADQGLKSDSSQDTLGDLLEKLPMDHRAQGLQLITGLVSDAFNLVNTQRQRDAVLAEYTRDMHLSDNKVRKAQLHLKEVLADVDRQRTELHNHHQYTMQAQANVQQQFDQKMAEISKLLADYRHTRDPNTLTMATHLLGCLRD